WRSLLGAALCSIAYSAATLAEPWPLKWIFDNVLDDKRFSTPFPWIDSIVGSDRTKILVAAAATILVLALVRSVLYFYQRILTTKTAQEVVAKVQRRLFAHLQRLSLSFHNRNRTGDLLTRVTGDVAALREVMVSTLLYFATEGFILGGLVVMMFLLSWRLALVTALVLPAILFFSGLYSGRIRAATRKQRVREGEMAGRLHEAIAGIHLVQMFAREDEEDARLRSINKKSLREGLKAARLEATLNRAVELSVGVATAATLWLGAIQVISGRLTTGELVVFVAYMQALYRPLRRISRVTKRAAKASANLERVTALLDERTDVRDGSRVAPAFAGEIRFEGVDFAYKRGTPVLNGIDLVVEAGSTVALVGATGGGKSTLVNLVPRLYDPVAGNVRIDGIDVREFTLKSLRDQISIVPQDGMLFAGTFHENIAYGKTGCTRDEVEEAARAALIHDVIQAYPEGYESVIGERGVTLSGGQRQRLAIARALLKDAPIVLLDEPTTALDAESESLVLIALERLLEKRTAILIAHRFSTIRRADMIVVVDQGRIVERGTHPELIARNGRYRQLSDLQAADSPWTPRVLAGRTT
ncbi:MAG TPA: ABC transporter ATP-binding protein, partial [Thermoanaerobaculia bacterium]|nr:ABC transporter ATP-binding protein [Thermoanaerobaculia bacterium]